MESQEGEFGAEVSAFLSGAACVCGFPCTCIPRSRPWMLVAARGD